jgi:hypothetical protein
MKTSKTPFTGVKAIAGRRRSLYRSELCTVLDIVTWWAYQVSYPKLCWTPSHPIDLPKDFAMGVRNLGATAEREEDNGLQRQMSCQTILQHCLDMSRERDLRSFMMLSFRSRNICINFTEKRHQIIVQNRCTSSTVANCRLGIYLMTDAVGETPGIFGPQNEAHPCLPLLREVFEL